MTIRREAMKTIRREAIKTIRRAEVKIIMKTRWMILMLSKYQFQRRERRATRLQGTKESAEAEKGS